MGKCEDCKGTGKYVGFRFIEDCQACSGTGIAGRAITAEFPAAERPSYTITNPSEWWLAKGYEGPSITVNVGRWNQVALVTSYENTRAAVEAKLEFFGRSRGGSVRLKYIGCGPFRVFFEEVKP